MIASSRTGFALNRSMAKALWLGAVAALVCMGRDANAFHTVVPFLGKGKGQISSQSFLSSTRVLVSPHLPKNPAFLSRSYYSACEGKVEIWLRMDI